MTDIRATCQRLTDEFLSQHAGVAERLQQGDTLARWAAISDVRNWVLRHYPRDDMDWYTWTVTRQQICALMPEVCGEQR